MDVGPSDVPTKQKITKFRWLSEDPVMQFQHTLGCEGAGMEGDPLLECRQQDTCHPPLFLAKIEFSDQRMKKKELCSGKSKGERRYDLSAIPWMYIFITEVDTGRFIGPH